MAKNFAITLNPYDLQTLENLENRRAMANNSQDFRSLLMIYLYMILLQCTDCKCSPRPELLTGNIEDWFLFYKPCRGVHCHFNERKAKQIVHTFFAFHNRITDKEAFSKRAFLSEMLISHLETVQRQAVEIERIFERHKEFVFAQGPLHWFLFNRPALFCTTLDLYWFLKKERMDGSELKPPR